MLLSKLIENLEVKEIIGNTNIDIKDIKTDSKQVGVGSLFVCLNGGSYDGHSFAREAKSYGAEAIICERRLDVSITQVIVESTRTILSHIASEFYGNPDKKIKIIGVVGTNGKTSTAHIIKTIVQNSGVKCGVIGTLGTFYGDVVLEPTLTTPDPLELFDILSKMASDGVKVVVMEVSAHAIYWEKINGIDFEIGIFTNFSQDHLDFFKNMENYKQAKLSFFDKRCKYIVSNSDDQTGLVIINKNSDAISYGIDNPADVFAIDIKEKKSSTSFILNLFDCIYDVNLKLMGKFNVYNAMAAATATALLGINTEIIARELSKIKSISGRLERVESKAFSVFIDYAHTPDGLQKALDALRSTCEKKLICVFGCGGNRDESKRKIMGRISGERADFTVITSDNPRYEEPMDIISQVEEGVLEVSKKYVIVQDRTEGILYALKMAKKGDTILIAGKGSERYQEILGIKHVYNDKDIVKELIRKLEI